MSDTIGLQFSENGEAQLTQAIRNVSAAMTKLNEQSKQFNETIIRLAASESNVAANANKLGSSHSAIRKELESMNTQAAIATTALGRFNIEVAGSAAKLQAFQSNMYAATQQGNLMGAQLIQNPITSLKAFAASTEKAAIASQYFKEQLTFIANSRFGSLMIWMTAIAGITETIKGAVEAAVQLEQAQKKVESAFVGTEKTLAEFGQIQNTILSGSLQFGQDYEKIGTILGIEVCRSFCFRCHGRP